MAHEAGERARRVVREFAAALLFFVVGCAFVLLAAVGPVYLGPAFDADRLGWIGAGLVIVSVYVTVGVSLPRLLQGAHDARRREDDDDTDAS